MKVVFVNVMENHFQSAESGFGPHSTIQACMKVVSVKKNTLQLGKCLEKIHFAAGKVVCARPTARKPLSGIVSLKVVPAREINFAAGKVD